jgi:hypothetical protein
MKAKRSEEELYLLWMMLDLEFIKLKPTSYEEAAVQVLELIFWKERLRRGLEATSRTRAVSDRAVLKRLRNWDSDEPMLLPIEKVFRRLATGRHADSMKLLEQAIKVKVEAFSREQRRKAESPRRQHPVDLLIIEIIRANPKVSAKELQRQLESGVGWNVIFSIDDDVVVPRDQAFTPIKTSGLPDRLSRLKRKIAKAG